MLRITIEFAYDEDFLDEALERLHFEYDLVTEVAGLATSGWPRVRLTGAFAEVTRWLAQCYDAGDGGWTQLEALKDAELVDA